jgi:hypothetical protein
MSKKNQTIGERPLANPKGKTVEELKEIAMTLQAQVNHHRGRRLHHHAKENQHQMMETKAQGGLEITLQMIPKEEVDKMITEEARENHQEMENSEG